MPPLILDSIAEGCDSYVMSMPHMPATAVRSWSFLGSLRSFAWRDGTLVKSRASFTSHTRHDDFYSLLEVASSAGLRRPSSYASFFHHAYHSPRMTGPCRRALTWGVPGGWESLLVPRGSELPGTWYRYDLRSAYTWALYAGLPDPSSYRFTEYRDSKLAGCYLADVLPSDGAPYPYDRGGLLPVTSEEIDRYNLRCSIRYGITWSVMLPPDDMLKAIYRWPFFKEVGRAYWGRWLSGASLDCATWRDGVKFKVWQLPPMDSNPIWAHLILGRVRQRLYDVVSSSNVARVYVDNVITDQPLPVGESVGDWRLEAVYNGLTVSNLHRITSQGEHHARRNSTPESPHHAPESAAEGWRAQGVEATGGIGASGRRPGGFPGTGADAYVGLGHAGASGLSLLPRVAGFDEISWP